MKKTNKKGFTLIELLATILIIGIVMTISIVGISYYLNKSEEKAILISKTNVLSSAQKYLKEYYKSDDWFSLIEDDDKEYSCVSIEQLKGAGYLDKNVDEEDYSFIIFKRNKDTKNIDYKSLADDSDDSLCNKKFIISPSLINKKEYTNHISVSWKISSELNEFDAELHNYYISRKVEVDSVEVYDESNNLKNATASIVPYGNNSLYGKLVLDIDQLEHDKKYQIKVNLKYVFYDSGGNIVGIPKTVKIGDVGNEVYISTKELKAPIIKINKLNEWKSQKDGLLSINTKDIYDINNSYLYFISSNSLYDVSVNSQSNILRFYSPNDNGNNTTFDLIKYDQDIYQWEEVEDYAKFTNEYIYKSPAKINNINFLLKDSSIVIKSYITDGTNFVSSVFNEDLKIDNKDYNCHIVKDNVVDKSGPISLQVRYKTGSTFVSEPVVDPDIIKGYKWDNQKSFQEFKGSSDGNISNRNISDYGKYSASVKLMTGKVVSCETNIQDKNAPDIELSVHKNDVSSSSIEIEDNQWYTGIYKIKIYTNIGNKISYCFGKNVNSCEFIESSNKEVTLTLTSSGKYIIKAKSFKASNNMESLEISKTIWIDNTIPNVPTSKVYIISNSSNVTKYFYSGHSSWSDTYKDTWTNIAVRWTDFNATDSHSGFNRVEYTTDCTNKTNVKKIGSSYDYDNVNYTVCLRSVDNVGNVSEWSKPYYFKVDNTPPTISVSLNNNYVNDTWRNLANVTASATCSDNKSGCTITYTTTGATTTSKTVGSSKKIVNEGLTNVVFTAKDGADNTTSSTVKIKLDRTPPKTSYLKMGAKDAGYTDSDFFTEYKKHSNGRYIYGSIEFENHLYTSYHGSGTLTQDKMKTLCNNGKGNCHYSAYKCYEGLLDYASDACKDSIDGGKTYSVDVPSSRRYIRWDLDDTGSIYENKYGNTQLMASTIKNNKYVTNLKIYNGINLVNEYFYNAKASSYNYVPLSFSGAADGTEVLYQRVCVDEAGNDSSLFSMLIDVRTYDTSYCQ